jgi:hypothetical protein
MRARAAMLESRALAPAAADTEEIVVIAGRHAR